MRLISLATVLMLSAGIANADMLDGLRQLRGALGEAVRTKHEIGSVNEKISPTKAPESPMEQRAKIKNAPIQSGDIVVAKIANVKVYKDSAKRSGKLTQISKSEEVVYMGEEQNGLYKIMVGENEGWVDKLLVKKP